jgi:glycosyltransferase involved in cell wall biosynthesis
MLPTISLITPSFQQQGYLKECLDSVHDQGYAGLEHIVVDGGSTDGSAKVIEDAAGRLAWWCSERDRGQSHAINKGLEHATGDVFGWLNSDDLLLPGALERVGEAFAADKELLIYGGQRIMRYPDGKEQRVELDDASNTAALFTAPKINQQSTFIRMDAVKAIGGVEEALHYCMDLELWWQLLFTHGTGHLRFDAVDLAIFRMHAQSKTGTGAKGFREETASILTGMAQQLEMEAWVHVLRTGYPDPATLRRMPLRELHRGIVERMVLRFLLKWHGTIHERTDFEMMREFRRTVSLDGVAVDAEAQEILKQLDRQLAVPNWTAFRLKRKLDHLAP